MSFFGMDVWLSMWKRSSLNSVWQFLALVLFVTRGQWLILQFMQPIWAEGDRSVEFYSSSGKSKSPPFYPRRVSLNILNKQNSRTLTTSSNLNSDSELESISEDISANSCSSESEAEMEVIDTNKKRNLHPDWFNYAGILVLKYYVCFL